MIEQQAKVIAINDDSVLLETERQSTCSKCSMNKGCGTGLLAKHVGQRFAQLEVTRTTDVRLGEQVRLAIPEEALLRGAFSMYIIPLLAMFAFSAAAIYLQQIFNFSEFIEIIAGVCGLWIGFYWVRHRVRTQKDSIQATILEE